MKNFTIYALIVILLTLSLFAPIYIGANYNTVFQHNEHREVAAVVDEINPSTGYITLVDAHGEAWVYESNYFREDQPVIIVFDDMGTDDIYDDEIVQIIFEKGA